MHIENEPVIIRPLRESDIPHLKPILRQHVRDLLSGDILEIEIDAITDSMRGMKDSYGRHRHYFVASTDSGQVLGCMAVGVPEPRMAAHFIPSLPNTLELLNVFVDSDLAPRRGIGSQLLRAVCEAARHANAPMLVVNSGPRYERSWGFYDKTFDRRHGLLADYYGPGRHAMTWSKALQKS